MLLQQPVVIEHLQIARRIRGLVHAVLLRRVSRGSKIHARAILVGADDLADARLHPGDRVGDATTLTPGVVRVAHLLHEIAQRGDVLLGEPETRLLLAPIGVADVDNVPVGRLGLEFGVVAEDGPLALVGAARQQRADSQYNQDLSAHTLNRAPRPRTHPPQAVIRCQMPMSLRGPVCPLKTRP